MSIEKIVNGPEQIECSCCGSMIDPDAVIVLGNGLTYCSDCVSSCGNCGEYHLNDELTEVYWNRAYSTRMICSSCLDEYAFQCDDCGEWFHSGYHSANRTANNDVVCENCFENNYRYCEDCDSIIRMDDAYYDEDDDCYRCSDCHNPIIKSHSYKPTPRFFSLPEESKIHKNLFLGTELELEVGDGDAKSLASDINDEFFYCKRDGSLNNGFEIVTHPFTRKWFYDALKGGRLDKVFELSKRGCKSYDTDTCGLHVHMSKDYFSTIHLYKFMKLMYENGLFWSVVSRRRIQAFDRWCSTKKDKHEICYESKHKRNSDSRYTALNITEHTIECRIFRGTLNKDSFVGNIEILLSMVDFTRVTSIRDISLENYRKFIHEQKTYKYAEKLLEKIFNKKGESED